MNHSELWTQWSFALNKALIAIHPISKQGAKWMILGFFCLRSFSKSKNIICDFLSYQNCDFMSCDFLSIYHFLSGRDRMVVGFTTTYAISAYHHWWCQFECRSGRDVQHYMYVIKFVSDLWQVDGFLRVLRFPPPMNLTATIHV